tara:strand:+ start:784 stop:1677 length:894 start_codon:yes stop_codon:yes gene_type:complete
MKPKICIGTAQFGLNYGVTNSVGKLSKKEIIKILREAKKENIKILDTASVYGDAESVIGEILGKNNDYKICSKFPSQRDKNFFNKMDVENWEQEFIKSLRNLKTANLETYFLHDPKDLVKEGNIFLKEWLRSLKRRNLVRRLGVSIYSKEELDNIPVDFLEVVQIPLSIYNQKLLRDGTIANLKKRDSIIYLRSIFMQGLLVSQASSWPGWISMREKEHHINFSKFAKQNNYKLIELCLDFVKNLKEVEAVILGFTNINELKEVIEFWRGNKKTIFCEYEKWSLSSESFIDPRNWPS